MHCKKGWSVPFNSNPRLYPGPAVIPLYPYIGYINVSAGNMLCDYITDHKSLMCLTDRFFKRIITHWLAHFNMHDYIIY